MIPHIDNDKSYLSDPWARSRTRGHYYLSSLSTETEKSPNIPPPVDGPIYTEFRTLKHVVASSSEVEVGGLFHNVKKDVLVRITLHDLGFSQSPTPIKTDNSAEKGIVAATVIHKRSKAIVIQFFWMKDGVKQRYFFVYWFFHKTSSTTSPLGNLCYIFVYGKYPT